jgi:hypothetical protein
MSFFSNLFDHGQSQKAHEQMYGGGGGGYGRQDSPHKSSWTEETVAAAAGFAGKKDRSILIVRKKGRIRIESSSSLCSVLIAKLFLCPNRTMRVDKIICHYYSFYRIFYS